MINRDDARRRSHLWYALFSALEAEYWRLVAAEQEDSVRAERVDHLAGKARAIADDYMHYGHYDTQVIRR